MNKTTEINQKTLETGNKFNIFEFILFELCIFSFGFTICTIFPKIILYNSKLFFGYLIFFLMGLSYTSYIYFKNNKSFQKKWKVNGIKIHLLKNFSYFDFTIYKLTIIILSIILCYFFPDFFLKPEFTPWYTLIFGTGVGYFIASINRKKRN